MAFRSLDNGLLEAHERPKKVPKLATAVAAKLGHRTSENTEPAMTPMAAEQSLEYLSSEDLKPLKDPDAKIMNLLNELDSKDWTKVCKALNDVRRFALHHAHLLLPILEQSLLVIVKAMKNPRSALCKTAIMTATDIFKSFGHLLMSLSNETVAFDNMLLQLLLKASQDKKFVCEEAEKALETMVGSITPLPLLNKLQSYVSHSNLRVRAKAAVVISNCISRMGFEVIKEFGLAPLLQISADLLNDKLPEAREAARSIICSIYLGYLKTANDDSKNDENGDGSAAARLWHELCSFNLPPIAAVSVEKIVLQ
ncbi:endoribonuclease Dicer [Apostasia shenzhenica]|uniref:Endoribonuclease Dicer n=1 Tax=Apostasia shenzhenica TaxID=1088818 RepID=A0A2I0B378_9ASPA|nr:endoribonuclease Dicer [Apostasia shenzhenica]